MYGLKIVFRVMMVIKQSSLIWLKKFFFKHSRQILIYTGEHHIIKLFIVTLQLTYVIFIHNYMQLDKLKIFMVHIFSMLYCW